MKEPASPKHLSTEFNTSTWTLNDWKDHIEWLERQEAVEARRLDIMDQMRDATITTDRE